MIDLSSVNDVSWLISTVILFIIMIESLRGFVFFRNRNLGILALSFLCLFGAKAVLSLGSYFNEGHWTVTSIMIWVCAWTSLQFIGIILIVYAFLDNEKFSQIRLHKWYLPLIIIASILFTLAYMSVAAPLFTMPVLEFNIQILFIHLRTWGTVIPLLLILVILIAQYRKTRNPDTIWIFFGFLCLFFTFTEIGLDSIESFADLIAINSYQQHRIEDMLNFMLELFSYLPFLIVMIKAKVMK